jgi:3-isopropylmalate/(R)-2-methylmalate dehydratase small subunit
MDAFTVHRGLVALLDQANIDTDQIIPKQFLKSIRRTGFGPSLFFDWRYGADGKENPDFELNKPRYGGASILVTRNNFGCGSSREHAVWAVMQYGFRVVIAPRGMSGEMEIPAFADIFRNNSAKNGLLTVELSEQEVQEIFDRVGEQPGAEAVVDLEHQTVTLLTDPETSYHFDVDAGVREALLQGLDHVAQTLEHADAISAFEQTHWTQTSA